MEENLEPSNKINNVKSENTTDSNSEVIKAPTSEKINTQEEEINLKEINLLFDKFD